MASTWSDLKFELIGTGDQTGTWGATTNDNIGTAIEQAIAGKADITMSSTTITLTLTDTTALQNARALYLNLSGSPGGAAVLNVPAIEKSYIVKNGADQTVTVKVSGLTGVAIPTGKTAIVYNNGTDVVTGIDYLTSLTLGTDLAVADGGTGLSSGTSGGIPYFSSTTAMASSGALTANQIVLGGGAGAAPVTSSLLATSAAVTSGTYIKAIGYADTVVALGNTGTAINLDVVSGGVFTATLTGSATITLRYPVSSGASSFTLILTNDGTAGRSVSWAGGSFLFPGGAASLNRTTTANAVDIWVFFTPDGGTTWYGNIAMRNLTA